MADIAVGLAIQLLKSLIKEAYLVSGLPNEITTLEKELNLILAFLKSAEERAEEDSGVKEWVKQVRILAYNIEDVIEEYQLSHKRGRWDNVMQICTLNSRSRVRCLRERASELGKQKDFYGLNVVGPGQCSYNDAQLTISSMCIAEEFEVGTEKPKNDIIELMGLNKLDSRTSTLTVVGKRGLGKTTVVGIVYKDTIVSEYFPFRAWVGVSQYHDTLDMFKSIAKQLYDTGQEALERYEEAGVIGLGLIAPDEVDRLDKDSLICRVQKFLQEKRSITGHGSLTFDDGVMQKQNQGATNKCSILYLIKIKLLPKTIQDREGISPLQCVT